MKLAPSRTRPVLYAAGDVVAAGESEVGGKALGLARLRAAGARVPDFLVVAPADDERPGFAEALRLALPGLGPGPYAVRSSMVGEDGGVHSFAGQLESFLGARDAAEVEAAVGRCRESGGSARALAYRAKAGLAGAPRVAVIVQRQVAARVAGVVFTADPATGRRDVARISASFGLGEGVVSGRLEADEFGYVRGRGVSFRHLAPKTRRVEADPAQGGTRVVSCPEPERGAPCLSESELRDLAEESFRIAFLFGEPLDIEWARDDAGLHLLQARPLVGAAPERRLFDNSNIQESFCGVTSPLSFSFAAASYASVYEQTARVLGVGEATLAALRPVYGRLLASIRGRVYYDLGSWYEALRVLPTFRRNKADMEKMMGVDRPVDLVPDDCVTRGQGLRRLPGLLWLGARLAFRLARLPGEVPRWLSAFEATLRRVDREHLRQRTPTELLAAIVTLRRELLERWHVPILNDIAVMRSTGRLRRLLEGLGGDVEARLAGLLGGVQGREALEPTRLLLAMARRARADAALGAALREGPPSQALAHARRASVEFSAALDLYLDRYGDRCIGELKLESVSPRQDPSSLVPTLRLYLDRDDLDPDTLRERDHDRLAYAEVLVRSSLPFLRRASLSRRLAAARGAIARREALRLARTRVFGLHRDLYRALGARLVQGGALDGEDDVFFLTTHEVAAYVEGRSATTDLRALVGLRRTEQAAHETVAMPHRIETCGLVYRPGPYADPDGPAGEAPSGALRGLGCQPGVVEAPVRLVRSAEEAAEGLAGRILVALRTDPGWTPLFPAVRGLLVERGSALSHSAVVARELGLPTIVGIPGLMDALRDGERVRMDGATGVVERLDPVARPPEGGERREQGERSERQAGVP